MLKVKCMSEEWRRTAQIIVGLGSNGSRIVDRIKKEFTVRVTKPVSTVFVAIDSDESSLNSLGDIEKENRLLLTKPTFEAIKSVAKFLQDTDLRVIATSTGLGRRRIGIPALLCTDSKRRLEAYFGKIASDFRIRGQNYVRVFIVTCSGGGTGSGLLPHLLEILDSVIYNNFGKHPLIIVFVILPSLARDEPEAVFNGYALLKELDYITRVARVSFTPIYVLFDQETAMGDIRAEIPRIISSFLMDFALIPIEKTVSGSKVISGLDEADLIAAMRAAASKNYFVMLGVNIVRFPRNALLWYYKSKKKIKELQKYLNDFKEGIKVLKNNIEKYRNEIRDINNRLRETGRIYEKISKSPLGRTYSNKLARISREIKDLSKISSSLQGSIENLEKKARNLFEKRDRLEEIFKELELSSKDMFNWLQFPPSTVYHNIIRLSENEIDKLRSYNFKTGSFREVMYFLNREDQYFTLTHEQLTQGNIIFNIPLNRKTLDIDELLRKTDIKEDKLRNRIKDIMTIEVGRLIISSDHVNKDYARLDAFNRDVVARFLDTKPGNLALRDLSSDRKYSFISYALMMGLPLSSPLPEVSIPFTTISKIKEKYEKCKLRDLYSFHSYLLPTDPSKASEIRNLESGFKLIENIVRYPIGGMKSLIELVEVKIRIISRRVGPIVSEIEDVSKKLGLKLTTDYSTKSLIRLRRRIEAYEANLERLNELLNQLNNIAKSSKDILESTSLYIAKASKKEAQILEDAIKEYFSIIDHTFIVTIPKISEDIEKQVRDLEEEKENFISEADVEKFSIGQRVPYDDILGRIDRITLKLKKSLEIKKELLSNLKITHELLNKVITEIESYRL